MKIEGQHSFDKGRQEIWKALQDPQTLAATLPGVKRLEVVGPDRYELSALVGVGSVKGTFDGTFSVEDKKDLEACTLRGKARGASGMADLEAAVHLADADGGGTLLTYNATANVTGPIAGVGQRMVAAASKKMAAQFFNAVDSYDGRVSAIESTTATSDGRRVFEAPPRQQDSRDFIRGLAVGFVLALIGVAVGRWSARR
jgi:uncharacterized protein